MENHVCETEATRVSATENPAGEQGIQHAIAGISRQVRSPHHSQASLLGRSMKTWVFVVAVVMSLLVPSQTVRPQAPRIVTCCWFCPEVKKMRCETDMPKPMCDAYGGREVGWCDECKGYQESDEE